MDHQLWALKRAGLDGSYRLMSLRGTTFLDLESGLVIAQSDGPTRRLLTHIVLEIQNRKQEDGSRVCAYNYVGEGKGRSHQEWIISDEGAGSYRSLGGVTSL